MVGKKRIKMGSKEEKEKLVSKKRLAVITRRNFYFDPFFFFAFNFSKYFARLSSTSCFCRKAAKFSFEYRN